MSRTSHQLFTNYLKSNKKNRPGTQVGFAPPEYQHILAVNTHYRNGQMHLIRPKRAGGDEGTRTPGLLRAREALSHLSYIPAPTLWACVDSNHGPHPYQRCALTDRATGP